MDTQPSEEQYHKIVCTEELPPPRLPAVLGGASSPQTSGEGLQPIAPPRSIFERLRLSSSALIFGTKILVPGSWYQDPGTKMLVPSYWFQNLGSGSWYQVNCRVQVLRVTPSQYLSCQKVMCSLVAEICISTCPSWPLWWNSTSSLSRSWFDCLTMLSWCFHHIAGGRQSDKLQLAISIWYGCPVRFWMMFLSFITSPTLGVCSELAARKLKPDSYPCRKVSAFSVVVRQHTPQTWKFSLH